MTFAIIFIIEMAIKLIALGLAWGPDAYLKSAWNWLDGLVVTVSIIDMADLGSGGFLKTLRILRAFRPLRSISRIQNLRVVVQTIFASLPALFTLFIVAVLFLLIFALLALSYLNGKFYACPIDDGDANPNGLTVGLLRNLGPDWVTPLCLRPSLDASASCLGGDSFDSDRCIAHPMGNFTGFPNLVDPTPPLTASSWRSWWNVGDCGSERPVQWQRASADTPICIGRCNPSDSWDSSESMPPAWLCPRELNKTVQLPHSCPSSQNRTQFLISAGWTAEQIAEEEYGEMYKEKMMRNLVMPCAGSSVDSATNQVNMYGPASVVSCKALFCPNVSPERRESCQSLCKSEPDFCASVCKTDGPRCDSCREECTAACECEDYCQPLIKDAALCHEQGLRWSAVLSQDFDDIVHSLVTLFEISTTEGWVDVMYAAADTTNTYEQPLRDNNQWHMALGFCFYIFFSFMFIVNLAVGVIVDQFMSLKQTDKGAMLTETQIQWVNSKKILYGRPLLFDLTNLHLLSPSRRKVYNLVSNPWFENSIMAAIVINTVLMGAKVFPTPTTYWTPSLEVANYFFAFVFTLEAALKMFALRGNYWKDSWNNFDFTCVMATAIGIVIKVVSSVNIAAITSVIRIFRIARLFRLLRFLKGLNQIFMAGLLSIPKLGNVILVLLLLLFLYSVLGVSLFSMVKSGETLNEYGNFKNFYYAFITLFRATTGEAWNEIMHDLSKDVVQFLNQRDWCSQSDLFNPADHYDLLKDKCLIDKPNSCVLHPIFPKIFWISFTMALSLIVMNLVIAVILEGYEEGKPSPEGEVVDICISSWRRYDPDQTMAINFQQAMQFIREVLQARGQDQELPTGISDMARMPMKAANAFELQVSEDGSVTFLNGTRQVLRFCCLAKGNSLDMDSTLKDLDETEKKMDPKSLLKLQKMERRKTHMERKPFAGDPCKSLPTVDLRAQVAATKLQRCFRRRWRRRGSRSKSKDEVAQGSLIAMKGAASPGLMSKTANDMESDAGKDAGRGNMPEDFQQVVTQVQDIGARTNKVGAAVNTPPVAG